MQTPESYVNERLDHLGVVAGVCQEIGLAAYLDRNATRFFLGCFFALLG